MKPADEARIAARLAKLMAMICVRNTREGLIIAFGCAEMAA
jgi:hypothetical protein